jgi:hypothetical protein
VVNNITFVANNVCSFVNLTYGLTNLDPGFDPGSDHVRFVVDKVILGQVSPQVLRFSPVNFIPPVLHYLGKRKKLIIFITGLHKKPQGCGASVASAAGPFTIKKPRHLVGYEESISRLDCFAEPPMPITYKAKMVPHSQLGCGGQIITNAA